MNEHLEGIPHRQDATLAEHLYVGIGGTARVLVEPRHSLALRDLCTALYRDRISFRVLGGGANLLVGDDGVEDVVVATQGARGVFKQGDSGELLRVDAGVSLSWLISKCRDDGLSGLEPLMGIPGTVGGVVLMNAGGKFGDMASLVREVVILRPDGNVEAIAADASHFGYRTSHFGEGVILEAVLQLSRAPKDTIFEKMREVLTYKRETQPLHLKTTGCFFKNPEGHSASRLLDEAGLKGERRGHATVSTLHANFFVNEGGASAKDFLELAVLARDRVHAQTGIELIPEVRLWNADWPALRP